MYAEYFTKSEAQKELLIFSMKDYLLSKWLRLTQIVTKLELAHKKKDISSATLVSMLGPLGYMVVQFVLLTDVFNKSLTIGQYMALITTIGMLEGSFISLAPTIGKLKAMNAMKVKLNLFYKKYIDQEYYSETVEEISPINFIEINNLFFKYPHSTNYSLKNINLSINPGDILVIVGENGSGKSTLAKIILGLHGIQNGQLFYNGVDINNIERGKLFSNMSVVTQDYLKYPFPLLENITLEADVKLEMVEEFCARFNYLLPDQKDLISDCLLGIDYEGSRQLSGGQWQRIAIARALYKDSRILVLDEATSAMDPETESKLMKDIVETREKKITIIVSHRLHIALYASKIIVVQNGEIVEHGTHMELMDNKGKYYNMVQSQTYQKEENQDGYRDIQRVI